MSLFSSALSKVKSAAQKVVSTVKSVVSSPKTTTPAKTTTSFGMGPGQLSGTGLIKNGPGGAGGGAATPTSTFTSNFVTSANSVFKPSTSSGGSSKSSPSIPSPTKLNTSSKVFTLVSPTPVMSPTSDQSFDGLNSGGSSGNGVLGHSGGQGLLPGSVSATTHGGFGMGPNQISGTKLLQGDKEDKGSILGNAFSNVWGAVKRPFVNAYNDFQQNGLYGGTLGRQTIPGMPNSPLARAATGIAQNNIGPALYDTLGAAGTGASAVLGAGFKAGHGITGFDSLNKASSFFTNMAANSQWNPLNAVPFNAGDPEQVMPANEVRDAQGENTDVRPGSTVADLQGNLSSDTIQTLDSIYKINNSGGEMALDISSLYDQPQDNMLTAVSPDGQQIQITREQYASNPTYWDQVLGDGGYQEVQSPVMVDEQYQIPQDPVEQQNLQQQYTALQKASGITEAITQAKEVESQMAAIEAALIKQRDAVMEDPDFSLATKEGRINYIFKNSMEARTYEALTKRAEVLSDFIDRQNEQIKTQLGFRQQDIQNQLAYQQANQPANRQTQVVTINGQQVLIDSQTGQPISNLGAQGDGSVDLSKDQRYQNYQARETQWNNVVGTISRFAPQGFNPASSNAWASVDWKAMANNKPAVDAIANAVTRMANPDITRAAAGGDPYATESLFGQAQQLVGQWFQDQNALPQKLQEAVGQAITYWNNSKSEMQQASAQPNRTSVSATDNTAFINAAKQAGYSDSQIQQYLAQQGGSTSAFNW